MESAQKQQIADRLNQANNILVTVSSNPSVDQLAACIGLTLALNKLGKHAAAVFSGQVPSTIEFLQPEKTLEKNTDSLRDFIIALDKSKADKLRYKVEDKIVKIFITPYKTSISEKDLEFSQGDFNVDVVVAIGVHSQVDIDQAITAHGRILHDATVATLNTKPGGELGSINLVGPGSSSLSELVVTVLDAMGKKVLDTQMATAFLTGIVAETQRFSNAKTSPQTMTVSAELMAAGANQQLVATKLEPPKPAPAPAPAPHVAAPPPEPKPVPAPLAQSKANEGMLEIDHGDKKAEELDLTPQIHIDQEGTLRPMGEMKEEEKKPEAPSAPAHADGQRMILQPPSLGAPMSGAVGGDPLSLPSPGNTMEDEERPSGAPPVDPANPASPSSLSSIGTLPSHQNVTPLPSTPPPSPLMPPTTGHTIMPPSAPPLPPLGQATSTPPADSGNDRTLSQIEQDIGSPHVVQPAGAVPPMDPLAGMATDNPQPAVDPGADLSDARTAVSRAINSQPTTGPLEPIAALNAQPVDLPLRDNPTPPPTPTNGGMVIGPTPDPMAPTDPNAPPPVPPPMMPPPS